MRTSIFSLFIISFAFFGAALANYQFLGTVTSFKATDKGVTLVCQGGHQLQLSVLRADLLRITLQRAGEAQPLLETALPVRNWPAVKFSLQEEQEAIHLNTDLLSIDILKNPCRLTIEDKNGLVLLQDDRGMGIGWDGQEVRCWKTIAGDEQFFGLGEKTGDVNKRGRQFTMWNSDVPGYTNDWDPIYQSIPFFIGLRQGQAYGVFLNNSYRSVFNMGAGNLRYYSFAADGGALDYFVIYGPRIGQVVESYTELTGRMPMPPRWALGYQQCRWSYYPDSEVRRLAQTFRDKKIPADVIYLDIHYMDGYRVFTWDGERFPDPAGLLKDLRQMGFKVVVIIDPGVKKDNQYEVARSGLAGDHFVKYPDGQIYVGQVWPGDAYFPDFSRAETRRWWGDLFAGLLNDGVKGFWCDMNEPACWGAAFPLETIWNDEGRYSSHKKMHNLYGSLMSQSTREGLQRLRPEERPFVITRAGFAGVQRYSAVWTGDNVATNDHLELGIRILQGLGLSGVSFIGTDVGGFMGTPTPELYARWMQVGALSPFFRTHTATGTADQEPWSFGEYVEEINKKTIEWRYQILPYLYSLIWQSHQTGAPILRPLFYHDQEDATTRYGEYQHQFFLGEKLLAAPVTRDGQYQKKIYLPKGRWLDWASEKIYQGPATVLVDAPLDRLPLFLREGGIIVTQESEQYVGEKDINDLTIDCFPGEGEFTLYEDDGQSMAYTQGTYRTTVLQVHRDASGWTWTKARSVDGYDPGSRTLTVRWHGLDHEPTAALLDGFKLSKSKDQISWNGEQRICTISFMDSGEKQSLTIR